MLIVFEGADGTGKSTLVKALSEILTPKHQVICTFAPGGTDAGMRIRNLLFGEGGLSGKVNPIAEAFLFAADMAQLISEVITPAQESAVILCDRWVYSGLVYQGALRKDKLEKTHPHGAAILREIYTLATLGVKPDVIVYVRAPRTVAQTSVLERESLSNLDVILQDNEKFDLVDKAYQQLFEHLRKSVPVVEVWNDRLRSPEVIAQQIIDQLNLS